MQAMALQVYAELQYRSLIDEPDLLAAEEVRQRVLTSGYLHSQHFSGLRENTETVRMLEHLHRNRSTFFLSVIDKKSAHVQKSTGQPV